MKLFSPHRFLGVTSVAVPILQSLLLADHVYRDQMTGKHIICGVFSTIYFTPNQPGTPAAGTQPGVSGGGGTGEDQGDGSGGGGTRRIDQPAKPQSLQSMMQAGSPYVYFSVTELTERKIFQVRYVDLHENRVLFQAEVGIECEDPLKTIEVTLPLPRLPLVALEERSYAVEVVCEGTLLGSHRVLARISPGPQPPAPPPSPELN
jgi:hypothetical protein